MYVAYEIETINNTTYNTDKLGCNNSTQLLHQLAVVTATKINDKYNNDKDKEHTHNIYIEEVKGSLN